MLGVRRCDATGSIVGLSTRMRRPTCLSPASKSLYQPRALETWHRYPPPREGPYDPLSALVRLCEYVSRAVVYALAFSLVA